MIRIILAIVFWLAFAITRQISVWGKPHDFRILTYIPWWSWLLGAIGIVLAISHLHRALRNS